MSTAFLLRDLERCRKIHLIHVHPGCECWIWNPDPSRLALVDTLNCDTYVILTLKRGSCTLLLLLFFELTSGALWVLAKIYSRLKD